MYEVWFYNCHGIRVFLEMVVTISSICIEKKLKLAAVSEPPVLESTIRVSQ